MSRHIRNNSFWLKLIDRLLVWDSMGTAQSAQTCCRSSISDEKPEVAVAGELPCHPPESPEHPEDASEQKIAINMPPAENLEMTAPAEAEGILEAVVVDEAAAKDASTYYPAELTFSPSSILCGRLAPKFWGNVITIILLGGSYRAALWSGFRITAAVAIASTLTLGTWQVASGSLLRTILHVYEYLNTTRSETDHFLQYRNNGAGMAAVQVGYGQSPYLGCAG